MAKFGDNISEGVSSDNDVDHYVSIRKMLDYIFNIKWERISAYPWLL
jgi:hypothetical protein